MEDIRKFIVKNQKKKVQIKSKNKQKNKAKYERAFTPFLKSPDKLLDLKVFRLN